MSAPRVSIIVPTYNRAGLIGRAIESVRTQTFSDWELIVVDDGSTDGTPAVVESYRPQLGTRLVVLAQTHGGASTARNTGIEHAQGEFVAFLDSDDEFLPEKLARQIQLLEREPALDFVYSDYAYIDLAGVRHPSAFAECHPLAREVPRRQAGPQMYVCTPSLVDYLVRGYFISTIVGMVRRRALGDHVRFRAGQCYSEEWLFFLDVAQRCRTGYVDEPLSLHHHVPHSVSRTSVVRNLTQQRTMLALLAERFPGSSGDARRAVRAQRSLCAQQLAWEMLRRGQAGRATRYFAEAFAQRPGVACARSLLGAFCRTLVPSRMTPEVTSR